MSEQRRERREQERLDAKAAEALVKEIRESLEDRPDHDEFKQATLQALALLDQNENPNNLIAAQLIQASEKAEQRGDVVTGQLMLYISGAVLAQPLASNVIEAIKRGIVHKPIGILPG